MRSVLAVAAHPGDLAAGCGGTLAAHRAAGDSVAMLVLAGTAAEPAARSLDCLLVQAKLDSLASPVDTVAAIENVLTGVDADVIYVHAPDDSQDEHRAVAAATLSAARHGRRVLHYRGPTTLRFEPSVFVDITPYLELKTANVSDPVTETASARHFGALARVRYAEAFAPTRFVWDV